MILKNDLLLQYRINGQMVRVYRSEPRTVENDSYYKGVAMAIADYLFYPYEVIAPRIESLKISFEHDDIETTYDVIEETTEGTVLAFLETNAYLAEEIIPPFDDQCPKEDICELRDKLNCKKKYIELKGAGHGYTEEFKVLAKQYITEILERRT